MNTQRSFLPIVLTDGAAAGAVGLIIALIVLANSNALIEALDHQFALGRPFLGWAAMGAIIGAVLSVVARVLEFGAHNGRSALDRIQNLDQLKAGEKASRTVLHIKYSMAAATVVFALVMVIVASATNSRYPFTGTADEKFAAVIGYGKFDKPTASALLHAALEDANQTLRAEAANGMGMQLLNVIRNTAKDAEDSQIRQIGKAASVLYERYISIAAKRVKDGTPDAFAVAMAMSVVDKSLALLWQGQLHETGKGGAPHDLVRAMDLYEASASLENIAAVKAIGSLARRMLNERNEEIRRRAYRYFDALARKGNLEAQLYLGVRYHKGDGVPADGSKATKLLLPLVTQEADANVRSQAFAVLAQTKLLEQEAASQLDKVSTKLALGKDAEARRLGFDYLERRAKEGDPGAQFWTAYRYRNGEAGAKRDVDTARFWFLKALQAENDLIRERALAALLDMRETGK